ncbi:MAG TPA: hypothetical protein VHQ87_10310 [Rhizobacter sp.]|nr:hypothetical protein [Rhizobacter sp.]
MSDAPATTEEALDLLRQARAILVRVSTVRRTLGMPELTCCYLMNSIDYLDAAGRALKDQTTQRAERTTT